jgi:hypothetical protein
MSDITDILLNVANKMQHKHNGKTLLIDGIEYDVYITADSFMFSPVSDDEYIHREYACIIPFGWQNTDEFRANYKNIRVITSKSKTK